MIHPAALPGFLAVFAEQPMRHSEGFDSASWLTAGSVQLCRWGSGSFTDVDRAAMIVSRVVRNTHGNVSVAEITRLLEDEPSALTRLLPPFGACMASGRGTVMVADSLGFQQMFHTSPGSSLRPAMSSSCLLLGRTTGAAIDARGVAVQSLLGWQLGQRTLFIDVEKLAPGAIATLTDTGVRVTDPAPSDPEEIDLEGAVQAAAVVLRCSLSAVLDDYPDAVLQLTGGMDSRLLLSAIPESRRRGLRAITLDVPGSGDAAIASLIARRYGIQHEVHGLAEVGDLSPSEAWDLCVAEAIRLDAMSDPVALGAQRVGERSFDQGVRISGLGGEIARGFYYFGRVKDRSYTRTEAERLASWRMCINDAAEPASFTSEFSAWARGVVYEEVHDALLAGGPEWFRATDQLYLRHRMQRWAGATDGAVSDHRVVVNPMLAPEFLDITAGLGPQDKSGAKFLAALQIELDPELGRVPLDGRPPPVAYANPPAWQPLLNGLRLAERAVRKAAQRAERRNRPPAGGTVMAAKVVEHWRAEPDVLKPLTSLGFIRTEWLDQVLCAQVEPRPSSVALLTNLFVLTSFIADHGIGKSWVEC